jgi:endonuclease/exonuclease/phosphatase family metal-dependent hydrolase
MVPALSSILAFLPAAACHHRGMRRSAGLIVALLLLAAGCSDEGTDTTEREGSAPAQVRVVSQNLLHGIACAPDSNQCELPDRVALFAQQLQDGGCPELVGIQESNVDMVALIRDAVADICDGAYEVVWDESEGLDREVVLTTLPVLGFQRERLAGPLRSALWVRVAADVGVVDFVSTHLASGSDDRPCSVDVCPPPCQPDDFVNACQARQTVAFADRTAAPDSVRILGGDFNAKPGEPAYAIIADAGYTDTHLEAGNPECDPATGAQCTSGRDDTSVAVLSDPSSTNDERIDFLWWGGDRSCTSVAPTGLFNAEPAVEAPGGFAFPADHTAVQATLECDTTDAQRAAATEATVASTTTTTVDANADAEATAGIAAAFETFFDGSQPDLTVRAAVLENGEQLLPALEEIFGQTADVAARASATVDSIVLTGPDTAEVTYSVLLDGEVALSAVAGNAVRVDGRWLVGQDTFCAIATQGSDTLPEPCR